MRGKHLAYSATEGICKFKRVQILKSIDESEFIYTKRKELNVPPTANRKRRKITLYNYEKMLGTAQFVLKKISLPNYLLNLLLFRNKSQNKIYL